MSMFLCFFHFFHILISLFRNNLELSIEQLIAEIEFDHTLKCQWVQTVHLEPRMIVVSELKDRDAHRFPCHAH